jgi:hypothetical protein
MQKEVVCYAAVVGKCRVSPAEQVRSEVRCSRLAVLCRSTDQSFAFTNISHQWCQLNTGVHSEDMSVYMHVFDDLNINKQAIYSIANPSSPLSQNPPGS